MPSLHPPDSVIRSPDRESATGGRMECIPLPPAPDQVARLSAFADLTYPRWQSLLKDADGVFEPGGGGCALCLWLGDQPVGLAVVLWATGTARLLSVMVRSTARRRGFGRALVMAAAEQARRAGAALLWAQHNDRLKTVAAYTACLDACGWPAATLTRVREQAPARWAREARHVYARHYDRLVRRGYGVKGWAEAGPTGRAEAEALFATGVAGQPGDSGAFDPFVTDAGDDPDLSVLLYRHDRVCGWIKAVWDIPVAGQPPSVVQYYCGWVLPELARQGWLVMAMIDVSLRQADLAGPETITAYDTHGSNVAMQGILSDRFGAFAARIDRLYVRSLPLVAPLAAPLAVVETPQAGVAEGATLSGLDHHRG